MRGWRMWLCGAWMLGLALAAPAAERFPPPDFGEGHTLPTATTPPPRSLPLEYLDVAVLAGALAVSTWLVLSKRSRRGVVWLGIFSLLYFGFYRKGCVCAIGSIQNVSLALADSSYAIPVPVIAFFLLPLLVALFFGRTFCAAVCPHGAIQDLVLLKPVTVPPWLDNSLRLLAFVYLGLAVVFAAVGASFIICQYDPFVPIFRRSGGLGMIVFGIALLAVGVFIGRPYCRYLCPYGVLLGFASVVSKWRVRITPTTCDQCRLCEQSCPVGAIQKSSAETDLIDRVRSRRRVAVAVLLLPLMVMIGAWIGTWVGATFSKRTLTVQLAERIALEEAGRVEGTTDYSAKFRDTGATIASLYDEARLLRKQFRRAGTWFGGWVGLVAGGKLLSATIRRRRKDYEADKMTCVGCARCYHYCPQEQVRLGGLSAAVDAPPTVA